jgi:hypothetical protein
MIKVRVTDTIGTLSGYVQCKNEKKEVLGSARVEKGSILYLEKDMYDYLNGANKLGRSFVELLEIEKEISIDTKEEEIVPIEEDLLVATEAEKVEEAPIEDITKMKFFELKSYAKNTLGLVFDNKVKKAELLELIESANKE